MSQNLNEIPKEFLKQPPATSAEIEEFVQKCQKEFKILLPEEYIDFLKIHNVLFYDELQIFATDKLPIAGYNDRFINSFIEMNLIRENAKIDRLTLGKDNGPEELVFNLVTKEYEIIDPVGQRTYEKYLSFGAMLIGCVKTRL